jgi:hypothetical protein
MQTDIYVCISRSRIIGDAWYSLFAVLIAVMDAPACNVGIYTGPVTTPVCSPVNPNAPSNRIDYCITLHAIVAVGLLVLYLRFYYYFIYLYILGLCSCVATEKKTFWIAGATWRQGRTYEAGEQRRATNVVLPDRVFLSYFLVVDFRLSEVRKCKINKIFNFILERWAIIFFTSLCFTTHVL